MEFYRVVIVQTLGLDRVDDRALADAVAAADLHVVGHRRHVGFRRHAAAQGCRLPQDHTVGNVGHIGFAADVVKVPGAVGDIAI